MSYTYHENQAAKFLTLAAKTADAGPHIAYLSEARQHLFDAEEMLVSELRDMAWSWAKIGAMFGMSRQAAWEKWHRVTDTESDVS